MKMQRKFAYSLLGGGGAVVSLLTSRGCLGSCSGCYSCLTVPGLIVGIALIKALKRDSKGEINGLVAGDH